MKDLKGKAKALGITIGMWVGAGIIIYLHTIYPEMWRILGLLGIFVLCWFLIYSGMHDFARPSSKGIHDFNPTLPPGTLKGMAPPAGQKVWVEHCGDKPKTKIVVHESAKGDEVTKHWNNLKAPNVEVLRAPAIKYSEHDDCD